MYAVLAGIEAAAGLVGVATAFDDVILGGLEDRSRQQQAMIQQVPLGT